MTKFDDILHEINEFGKYQKTRFLLLCFAGVIPPIAVYLHAFIAAKPDFM